ncbi:MAG TPA: GMC family oxidoreductase [Oscillatoriaceae cyanobacterium]
MSEWNPAVDDHYDRDLELDADAIVIGTGAGGAVFASELAEAGKSVIMLEKGAYNTRKDFNQTEKDMMPLLFEDAGARTTKDGNITILHGKTVGGSTTVNWAICFDPPAKVLDEWADTYGVESIRYADLKPHIDKVRFVLNVQKLEPHEVNENGRLLFEGARKIGMQADRFEHSRTKCLGSGFCILGCAYDRKQSMLVTYVPRALHFGAKLYPNAEVLEFERTGDRINAVKGVLTNRHTGAKHRFRATGKLVSVSGGAISTPQTLLRAGIANESGRLGKNLTLHPTTAIVAVFDHEVKGYQGINYTTYVKDLEPEGIIIESVFAYPGLMGANLYAWGPHAMDVMARYNHLAAAIVLLHDDGRGEVSVDKYGLPVIDYRVSPKDQAKFRRGLKAVARIYFAMGAKKVIVPHSAGVELASEAELDKIDRMALDVDKLATFSAHQMGTAMMGSDPARSVTDSWGKVHGYENLYVVDGSLFPTSIGVNPQISIASLATRCARHVVESTKTL